MFLPSTLRGLRSAQGALPPSFLAAAWRGLAGPSSGGAAAASSGSSSSGSDAPPALPAAADEQQQPTGSQQLQEHIIAVDRSGLINPAPHSHDPAVLAAQVASAGVVKEAETPLARHLRTVIQVGVAGEGRHVSCAGLCCAAAVSPMACLPPLPLPTCPALPPAPPPSLAAAPSPWLSTWVRR